jgi:hypothetical protein
VLYSRIFWSHGRCTCYTKVNKIGAEGQKNIDLLSTFSCRVSIFMRKLALGIILTFNSPRKKRVYRGLVLHV